MKRTEVKLSLGTSVPMLVLCLICARGAQAVTMLNVAHRGLWKEAEYFAGRAPVHRLEYAIIKSIMEEAFES